MANWSFAPVIASLGPDAAFRIINTARPPQDYVFEGFLPERQKPGYYVRGGSMTIRSTMAGLVGMDSPYPETGLMEVSTFLEQSAKIANKVTLTEQAQRDLQDLMLRLGQDQQLEAMRTTVLNMVDKLITQAHLDTFEYLRGQCLTKGAIDWSMNGKRVQVDYGIPTANKFAQRTGTARYGGSASVFWADHLAALSILKRVRAIVGHPDTINQIISNPANNIVLTNQDALGGASFVRATDSTRLVQSADARERLTIIPHSAEGEILDPANPGKSILVPFMSTGYLIYVGEPTPRGFEVGLGSAAEGPTTGLELGYTHIAPTVEGQGRMGRWGDVYTPQTEPWQVVARGVTNGLPVLEAYDRVVILSTAMS
jgi:hypothetical protein